MQAWTKKQLAAAMVANGRLTEWQAEKLLEGKFKGFKLDDFTLLRHLRRTPIAQQYVAEHTLTKHKVVLKIMPPSLVGDSAYLERFRMEAGDGEVHQGGGVYYIVAPYIQGLENSI
jgi:serine/threonine-protein kinase